MFVLQSAGLDDPALVPAVLAALADVYRELNGDLRDAIIVLPGVAALLGTLAGRGALQTVVAGNIAPAAAAKISAARLEASLRLEWGAFGSDHHERSELVRLGMERVAAAGHDVVLDSVWVVGDTPRDLAAARANSVRCALVATSWPVSFPWCGASLTPGPPCSSSNSTCTLRCRCARMMLRRERHVPPTDNFATNKNNPGGSTMEVSGTYDGRFEQLATLLHESVESGADLGGSVAVVLDGEMVVDIWSGWADTERTAPWGRDTITNVWSTTKTMTALAALVLVDRGELDVHAPVARYWPEFAANGKEAIEVRHLMSHTSGVAGWDPPVTVADILDPVASVEALAAQAPWWEPGSASGYHGINQGHLIGEVVRRITGQSLGTFFAEEIAGPLGADFHIGLDAKHDGRVATVVPPPPMEFDLDAMDPTSPGFRFFVGPVIDPSFCNTPEWRRAEIGAAGGQGNARSVARIQSVVSHGGEVDGVRLLSPSTIELIFEEQSNGVDLCLGIPLRFGVGYALVDTENFPYLPDSKVCFWGGWGGSMVINDLERRMTIAYMMNKMEAGIIGGVRSEALIRATYDVLGVPLRT